MCSVRNDVKWRPIHHHTADNHMNYISDKNALNMHLHIHVLYNGNTSGFPHQRTVIYT